MNAAKSRWGNWLGVNESRESLIAYFRSGWAFFIPYLAVYLLYAWQDWPVNPGAAGAGIVKGISESAASHIPSIPHSLIPALLHVYWFIHAANLILATLALIAWWRQRSVLSPRFPVLSLLVPWFCLALLFWIPGIYLEWPSDPWEHLRRINEWHAHSLVTEHSSWRKSSYFLPYSLTQHVTGLTQLSWLNLYYTAMCLLLSWQYYQLARAVGLGKRAAMIFVILQALLMGNNVFSFYRYYGLSSSILAQIGAVALTRLALEAAKNPQLSLRGFFFRPGHHSEKKRKGDFPAPSLPHSLSTSRTTSFLHSHTPSLLLLAPCSLLLLFTFFNHIQGLGIAGLGILAVIVWRLIEWRRSMIGWLALAAVTASVAAVFWFPRHPAIDELYRPQGWLNGWYGFNLFSTGSPAFERSLHILGTFGLVNIPLSLWLVLRRNHVAGWLTLMPVTVLALPCFALPQVNFVTAENPSEDIQIFHRLLWAAPMGLAFVAVLSRIGSSYVHGSPSLPEVRSLHEPSLGYRMMAIAGCFILFTLGFPAEKPTFNRIWHSLQTTADDLCLRSIIAAWTPANLTLAADDDTLTVTSPLGSRVQDVLAPKHNWWRWRLIHDPLSAAKIEHTLEWFRDPFSTVASLHPASTSPPQPPRNIANLTAPGISWIYRSGNPPELAADDAGLIIQNPPGAATHAFAQELIPVEHGKRYKLCATVRQSGDVNAINYLAVAWHDKDGRLLGSNEPAPEGAGNPLGWSNGAYSYFGLTGQPAPADWSTYTISFGLGEQAEIPASAAFMQAGALFNYESSPNAVIQLTRLLVQEKAPYHRILVMIPRAQEQIIPASHAARLSGHWLPSRVHIDYAGVDELRTAASRGANR